MTPRLTSSVSKNQTKLPPDILSLISESVKESFESFLNEKELVAEGEIYLEEVLLRIGFREKGGLRQMNFECSLDYSNEKPEEVMERIYDGLDALQSMLDQYIENEGDVEFPLSWQAYDLGDKKIYLKTSTENSSLEEQANKLLGEDFIETTEGLDEEFVDELFAKLRHMRHQN